MNINDSLKQYEYMVRRVIRRYFPKEFKDEDVYQAGMIGLWKALKSEKLNSYNNIEGFMTKCIKGEIIRELNKNIGRKPQSFDIDISSLDYSYLMEFNNLNNEVEDADYKKIYINDYINNLSQRGQQIFSLKAQGNTIKEIAEVLGISVGLVCTELKQIKKDILKLCY